MPTPKEYNTATQRQAAYRQRCRERAHAELGPGLAAVPSTQGKRRWKAMSRQAVSILEKAASEMEAYYDRKPDKWQEWKQESRFAR